MEIFNLDVILQINRRLSLNRIDKNEHEIERERERHRRRGHMVKKDGSFIFSARLYISLYRFCIDIRMSLKRSRNLSLVLRVSSRDKHRCICILLTNERFIDLAPFCSARIFISDKTLRPTTTRIVTAVSFTTVVKNSKTVRPAYINSSR